jgi:hypothetical protein
MPARTQLTFDEQLASEAAFRGWPLDLKWSAQAQAMYRGILEQTQGRDIIEEAGGVSDEPNDYFVGPPRVADATDMMTESDGGLPSTKQRR